eukprot:TRINITY_DN122373_c0_g1_i1.p1 TRINITY_DN122373_c0_g1~~TRINITY_DN122373_c0_g1_i1.p1  ORF type:complete len:790 (-),score=158.54 TRINITY_DN122373_c0_g1_i1:249-2618(-)
MGNRAFCCGRVCPKAALAGQDHDFLEEAQGCDPAGTVFQDTLEDLNEVDKLLLFFASSSNLAAVRWLLILGASANACDTNGTTCLHAACRSGSLPVVKEFIRHGLSVTATDVAGWTALHVAIFMGRRAVSVHLMEHGADLQQPNLRGLTPLELCNDPWLREAIMACLRHRQARGGETQWQCAREREIDEDIQVSSRLRFEPFFVPRAPLLRDEHASRQRHCPTAFQRAGIEIFNNRPGQGLAFLVVTGIVRDYPIELSSFLMENNVSTQQVGEFLGEDFSLAQTLRLEFMNSMRLTGTGVVSCLLKVFKQFQIPSDFQKIDRLVDGVAQIWWRQHEQVQDYPHMVSCLGQEDVEGISLMRLMSNYGTLHQLMFSTILLHWNLYAALPDSRRLSREDWLDLNGGILRGEDQEELSEGLQRLQASIFQIIKKGFVPQFRIWSSESGAEEPEVTGETNSLGKPATPKPSSNALSDEEQVVTFCGRDSSRGSLEDAAQGWVRLLSGSFPTPAGASGTFTYRHIRNILSEASAMPLNSTASPAVSRSFSRADGGNGVPSRGSSRPEWPVEVAEPMAPLAYRFSMPHLGSEALGGSLGAAARRGLGSITENNTLAATCSGSTVEREPQGHRENVWLTLRQGQMFLAPKSRDWAPYAFLSMDPQTCFTADESALTLTLMRSSSCVRGGGFRSVKAGGGAARPVRPEGGDMAESLEGGEEGEDGFAATTPLNMVFLLPDGRWQVLDVPKFQVQVPDARQVAVWRAALLKERCREVRPHATRKNGLAKAPAKAGDTRV